MTHDIERHGFAIVAGMLQSDEQRELLSRPLLLHASGRSTSASHRRVLHVEYAGFQLPPGLEWHEAF